MLRAQQTLGQQFNQVQPIDTQQQQERVLQPAINGQCSSVSIENSLFTLANGVYKQISNEIYRRADNVKIPGIIAAIDAQKWCLSFSFVDNLDQLSIQEVRQRCGANLECCMLVGSVEKGQASDLANPQRLWDVNLNEHKGSTDGELKVTCVEAQSSKFFHFLKLVVLI